MTEDVGGVRSALIPKLRNHDSCYPALCRDGRIVNVSQIKHLDGRTNRPQRRRWVAGNAIWYKSYRDIRCLKWSRSARHIACKAPRSRANVRKPTSPVCGRLMPARQRNCETLHADIEITPGSAPNRQKGGTRGSLWKSAMSVPGQSRPSHLA